MADRAIGVRLGVVLGYIAAAEIEDHSGPKLFDSFEAMLRANDVTPPARNRWESDVRRVPQKAGKAKR
jgi:hypothetical protein